MKLQPLIKSIATLGPLGYRNGSGTLGTAVALLGVYLLHSNIADIYLQIFLIFILLLLSLFVINKSFKQFKSTDPKEIIIDEVAGCFVVFCGLPFTIGSVILGFLLFRFLDITKLLGISYLEKKLNGSLGILADDLAAALLANFALRFIL